MLTDRFNDNWFQTLRALGNDHPRQHSVSLLVDGAFIPGLHRKIAKVCTPILLFESLPGCSEEAKDVSPMLVPFQPSSPVLDEFLGVCSGYPMVSALITVEAPAKLAARLAAWCLVDAGGQYFHFRIADTRRLPGIYRALTPPQRHSLHGPAIAWHYVDRSGHWSKIVLDSQDGPVPEAPPKLSDEQFALLVDDAEADSLLVLLEDRGHVWTSPSKAHEAVCSAMRTADAARVPEAELLTWCEEFINRLPSHP